MLKFELKEEYIPAGTVEDYKDKYGEDFDDLVVASLSYQKVRAIMYVSSGQGKIFSVVENFYFGGGKVVESDMTMAPCAIERLLHRLILDSNVEGYELGRAEIPCGNRTFTEKERNQVQHDIYCELLDKTSDAFPIFVHVYQNEWEDTGTFENLRISVFFDKQRVEAEHFFQMVKSVVFDHSHNK